MTAYDAPGITNRENVDSLTHQQIYDAFQTVGDDSADVATTWQQAGTQWRTSTTGMVQAVRGAVDGHWTGSAADAAVAAVTGYGNQATELADLFDQTGQVVTTTAHAALTTKSYIPKPVPVSADPSKDPSAFDDQTRSARKAQDDARHIMQQRYLVPITDQDGRLPTYPPANMPTVPGLSADNRLTSANNGSPLTIPDFPAAATHAAGLESSVPGLHGPGVQEIFDNPESVLHNPESLLNGQDSSPQNPESLFRNSESLLPGANGSPVMFHPNGVDGLQGSPQLPQEFHPSSHTSDTGFPGGHTSDNGLPAAPFATHDSPGGVQYGPHDSDSFVPHHDQPHYDQAQYDVPHHDHSLTTPASDGAAAQNTTVSSTDLQPGRDSLAAPQDSGASQPTNQPAPSSTPDVGRSAAPNPAPMPTDTSRLGSSVPGMIPSPPPSIPGPTLNTPPLIPAAPIPPLPVAPPLPSAPITPAPLPSAPIPAAPMPSAPLPNPPAPAPNPGISIPGPAVPAPGTAGPTPGAPAPIPQTPAPTAPAPKPISNHPAPGSTVPHPGAPNPVGPDTLAEPAATAVTGAAAVELSDDGHHHPGDSPRAPRVRMRYEGDRDRLSKQVDLKHESHAAEMARIDDYVEPTIGE